MRSIDPSNDPVRCRPATPADLAALCALGDDVNRMHHEAWPHVFAAPAAEPAADGGYWRQSLQGGPNAAFVAEVGADVVGFVTAAVTDETHPLLQPVRLLRIATLGVAAAHRGRGIGRALVARAEDWGRAMGATDVRLNVWAFNSGAARLYERLGYDVRLLGLGKRLDAAGAPMRPAAAGDAPRAAARPPTNAGALRSPAQD